MIITSKNSKKVHRISNKISIFLTFETHTERSTNYQICFRGHVTYAELAAVRGHQAAIVDDRQELKVVSFPDLVIVMVMSWCDLHGTWTSSI